MRLPEANELTGGLMMPELAMANGDKSAEQKQVEWTKEIETRREEAAKDPTIHAVFAQRYPLE
ncbi:MAG: hypothetical protein WAV41_02010 [Microgenomates group bacterium]